MTGADTTWVSSTNAACLLADVGRGVGGSRLGATALEGQVDHVAGAVGVLAGGGVADLVAVEKRRAKDELGLALLVTGDQWLGWVVLVGDRVGLARCAGQCRQYLLLLLRAGGLALGETDRRGGWADRRTGGRLLDHAANHEVPVTVGSGVSPAPRAHSSPTQPVPGRLLCTQPTRLGR